MLMYNDLKLKFKQKALIIIRHVSWAPNQHIGIISEGSRGTEDWKEIQLYHPKTTFLNILKKKSYFKR